jgi:tetrahydromethanopterin S-methyltransferase subunit G
MSSEIPIKEISELLDEISKKVPKLIGGLIEALFSAEAGQKMGRAVGAYYKELLEAGIPKEDALKMARDYMQAMKSIVDDYSRQISVAK